MKTLTRYSTHPMPEHSSSKPQHEGVPAQEKEVSPYVVHDATPQDADAIADIQYTSWLDTYPSADLGITTEDVQRKQGDKQAKRDKWRKSLLEQAQTDERKTFVVKRGEQVFGFCVAKKGDVEQEIQAIYLDPQEKGKGVRGAIFAHALAWLGREKPVKLEVAAHNTGAIAFYERFGFVLDGEVTPYDMGEGKKMPLIVMRRPGQISVV